MATSCTDTCQRDIMFQNVRGLQETKLEELVSCMTSANLGAAILAETWRPRDPDPTSLISNRGTYLLLNGAAQEDGKPTRGGVGILLNERNARTNTCSLLSLT